MKNIVSRMINDANVTFNAALRTNERLATNGSLLFIDPMSNYRSYEITEYDPLSIALPHERYECKYQLAIITHEGSRWSRRFVVTKDGEFREVTDRTHPDTSMVEVDREVIIKLAAQIHSALPAL